VKTTTYSTARTLPGAAAPCWTELDQQGDGMAVRRARLRTSAPLLLDAPRISPVLPVHGSGLSFAGSGDDATALPPRGAPV
jgi:hypothetical protein